ncbi:MAG: dipeptide epimerase [Pseudomonadota bacterium]
MSRLELQIDIEHWPLREPFVISGYRWAALELMRVRLHEGDHCGQGEGAPIFYRPQESAATLAEQVRTLCSDGVPDRAALAARGISNGAGNALDAALWDLEWQRTGKPCWQGLGGPAPEPKLTMYTITIDTPEAMAAKAQTLAAEFPLLKLKLGADDAQDVARVEAVRAAAPEARLVIDANAGWTVDQLRSYAPPLDRAGVELIEQPLDPAQDALLDGLKLPVPLCADESCQDLDSLPALQGRYQYINIKLDKIGGLTRALKLRSLAQGLGLHTMVGNMLGTSLAMAPAFLLAQGCEFADLDGPTSFCEDRQPATQYRNGYMLVPAAGTWGGF